MTFSQDEINLMCIYDTSDKTELLKELRFSVPYIEDTELKEITETVIDKLERMTNDEFSKLELEPDFDMADEKDFREPDGATQDYELDEVFELAFEIDAFLRAHNLKYRTKFPMEQRQREILADKMLESDTFYIKHLISSVLGHEGDALMNRLNAYETEL